MAPSGVEGQRRRRSRFSRPATVGRLFDLSCRFLPGAGILAPSPAMSLSSQFIRPAEAQIEREPGAARISFTVPDDFFFCRGHFPGQPIVPGAVVAGWMLEAAGLAGDSAAALHELQNLKFRSPLAPGDAVAVRAEAAASGFRVTVRSGERLCADAIFSP